MAEAAASRRQAPRTRKKKPAGPVGPGPEAGAGPDGASGTPAAGPAREPEFDAAAETAALELLASGEIDVQGRLVDASNATLYCTVSAGERQVTAVYKPVAGERPLWDFPDGTLAGREVAAYLVSRAAGWNVVPPTVYRDGPFGPGMCQLWIDTDDSVNLVELARSADDPRLRQMAVFDAVINNADRKIGHLLPDPAGRLYGCDHGVCFGTEYKMRTVLWQWRGKRLTGPALAALAACAELLDGGELEGQLGGLITRQEIAATRHRVGQLLSRKVHPAPPSDWPAVPWPPI